MIDEETLAKKKNLKKHKHLSKSTKRTTDKTKKVEIGKETGVLKEVLKQTYLRKCRRASGAANTTKTTTLREDFV